MSRSVSAAIQTGLDAHVNVPVYLVEVLLDTPLYWTTSDAVTWDSHSWIATGLSVDQITESGGRLRVRNDNNSGSALVLNNTLRDTEFRVYLYYNTDAVEVFRGYGGGATITAMHTVINLHANRAARTKAPRGRIALPVFTYLPKPGDVLVWGDERLRVTN
jgi:hypothetical protein